MCGCSDIESDDRFFYSRVDELQPGTAYIFRVRALNLNGVGDYSVASERAVTKTCAASMPLQLCSSNSLQSSVLLSWRSPRCSGGSTILEYEVQQALADEWDWSTVRSDAAITETQWTTVDTVQTRIDERYIVSTIRGLQSGTQFQFRVRAVSAVGVGEWTEPPTLITTSVQVPAAVAAFHVSPDSCTRNSLVLGWCKSQDSRPQDKFVIEQITLDDSGGAMGGDSLRTNWIPCKLVSEAREPDLYVSCRIYNLQPSCRYSFRIRVIADGGKSDWVELAAPFTFPNQPPDAPPYVWCSATGTSSGVVGWTSGLSDGGDRQVEFETQYRRIGVDECAEEQWIHSQHSAVACTTVIKDLTATQQESVATSGDVSIHAADIRPKRFCVNLHALVSNSKYAVRVRAITSAGSSDWMEADCLIYTGILCGIDQCHAV